MELKKVDDVRFEVEQDASKGMKTSVRVYATKHMSEKMQQDGTITQAVNAATLPGIVGKVMVMPDGHQGYGFPVGGVVAFDAEEGIISPGAIGFDINCLHPDSRVQNEFGAWVRIKDLVLEEYGVVTFDNDSKSRIKAMPIAFMSRPEKGDVFRIRSKSGKEIIATADHPFLTKRGMVKVGDLTSADFIVVSGFEGLEYRRPEGTMIVDKNALLGALDKMGVGERGNARAQILNDLKRLGLHEIKADSPNLPVLIKLLGILFGDGTTPKVKSRTRYTTFYGKLEDLLDVKKDLERLGFKPVLSTRKRHSKITTFYGISEFDHQEHALLVNSTCFSAVMVALGAPYGKKTSQEYPIPDWLMRSESWQKRLFLAAFFGAEMSTPVTNNGYNFTMLSLSVSKSVKFVDGAVSMLNQIKCMLADLEIRTSSPKLVEGYRYVGVGGGESVGFRMSIMSETKNLLRFFRTVGYEYNRSKQRVASLACLYLRNLEEIRWYRGITRMIAVKMHNRGSSVKEIINNLTDENTNEGFIKHSIWEARGSPRIYRAQKFDEFCRENEVGNSGLVYDRLESIYKFDYGGKVFDITVNDPNHNFMANEIIVSNCGVRLIKTNLTEKEVRPKLEKLMDRLFANVPSGVGSKLKIGLTQNDLKKVVEEGVSHMVAKGFGYKEDVERIEENGTVMGADIDKVSPMARKRGMEALGTLGAGNHFLEVQKIDKIFSEKIAKSYGLHEGQIVIMIHTGSRGFGHQICSDYLQSLLEYQRKNNIKLVDPELSYAKIGTKEAENYLGAMNCAVNYAFTNRQIITNSIRKSFEETFEKNSDQLGMDLLYDVAHNIAKLEEHIFEGKRLNVYVHRKGATRAFAKGREDIPKVYRGVGQPVIIPGSMGTASYVLCGKQGAMDETFGSTCHGSGRLMSRHQAIRDIPAQKTFTDLEKKKIVIRVRTRKLISEEAEWAYKNVDEVVQVVEKAGISDIVSRNVPIGVAKG